MGIVEESTPLNSTHQRQGNPGSDKKSIFIERDERQCRQYQLFYNKESLHSVYYFIDLILVFLWRPTRQMYASPRRRRCQCVHRRSPGSDPDPSDSEWESASMVSGTSTVSGRQ